MLILSVELKNIKSHRDTTLSFAPGINVLSGPNGVGKSTIFEAIGYALFGVNAQDFVSRIDRFLSIGAKRGEISVTFQPGDGACYRVTRTVGASAKWLLAKKMGDEFEVEDHANLQETETRIATLLGLNNGRSLAEQFKLVIGPFQNEFLGPFVIKQPTKRQDAFDEILGIDAWRKTFDGTKALMAAVQAKGETLKAEVAGKEEQVAALPAKLLELTGVQESEAAKAAELSAQNAVLEEATALLAALDAEKASLDQSQNELTAVEERIASGKDHVATQQLLVEQARSAAALAAASRQGKDSYDGAEERLKSLRLDEQQKLSLERKGAELAKDLSATAATLEVEKREVRELASTVETDGQKLAAQHEALTQSLARVQAEMGAHKERVARIEGCINSFRELPLHRVEGTVPYLLAAADRRSRVEADAQDKKEALLAEESALAKARELPALKERLERAQKEKAELSGRRLSLLEGKERLASGECPYFHEACRNLSDAGADDVFTGKVAKLDDAIAAIDADARDLAAQLAVAQEAEKEVATCAAVRAELQKLAGEAVKVEQEFSRLWQPVAPAVLLETLERWRAAAPVDLPLPPERLLHRTAAPPTHRPQLEQWSTEVKEVVQRLEDALAARLKEAQEPVAADEKAQVELRARGEELSRLRADLESRKKKLEARVASIQAQEKRLEAERLALEEVKGQLIRYDGLGERIAAAEADLERFRGDRDVFIANQQAAGELEKRQETLGKYQQRLQQLEEQRAALAQELERARSRYSGERHDSARLKREQTVSRVATLRAELSALAENARRLAGEVAQLSALAEELEKKRGEIERLARQATLVKFLRNQVFKNVSAQLSERFREEISFRADRIYRSIAESDEELYWGENYQVVLKDLVDGAVRQRTDDQLSGGQLMSAVVALRLALLQTIGARFAFFDEPTSNLDAERRENLARAFRAIDVGQEEVTEHWYDQLFLVSHDVSFTEITDQMLQLGEARQR